MIQSNTFFDHARSFAAYDESFFDTSMSNLLKTPPTSHGPAQDSQPASLDELNIKVPRKSSAQNVSISHYFFIVLVML